MRRRYPGTLGRTLAITCSAAFLCGSLSTGARAANLPFLPIGGNVMTYRAALDIDWVPESFTVIGGGVIGLEMGMVFQRLGSKLTVLELTDSLLPGTDPELVKVVETGAGSEGIAVRPDGVEVWVTNRAADTVSVIGKLMPSSALTWNWKVGPAIAGSVTV